MINHGHERKLFLANIRDRAFDILIVTIRLISFDFGVLWFEDE